MTFHCYLNELQSKESVLYTLYTPTITINHRVVAEESILPLVTVIEREREDTNQEYEVRSHQWN